MSVSLADVVREGDVTDSQLRAVLAKEPIDWSWAGGQFDTPTDEAVLASDAPLEFTWHADHTDAAPAAGAANDLQMVHLLIFSTSSQPELLRVFSSLDSYTPDEDAWQKLNVASGSEAITLSLTSGTFSGDQLTLDGGPYIGQKLSFTIE